MPKLLEELAQKVKEGAMCGLGQTAHKLYAKRIQDDMKKQVDHYNLQIESVGKRQNKIIYSFLKSKDTIIEQTNDMA